MSFMCFCKSTIKLANVLVYKSILACKFVLQQTHTVVLFNTLCVNFEQVTQNVLFQEITQICVKLRITHSCVFLTQLFLVYYK